MRIRAILSLLVPLAAAACGGAFPAAFEGIRSTRDLVRSGTGAASTTVTAASHGPWSSLPTQVAFARGTATDPAGLQRWARTELGIQLDPSDTVIGPDGGQLLRFQQKHQGLPVRGATYTGHLDSGQVAEATGLVFGDVSVNPDPSLSLDAAAQRARARWPEVVLLEGATLEILPVLHDGGTRFHLVHVLPVLDRRGGGIWAIHVDAHTGEIVEVEALSSPMWSLQATAGGGIDGYGRTVSFATEHTSEIPPPAQGPIIEDLREGYRLRDVGRNLHTTSLDGATDVAIKDFAEDAHGRLFYTSWEYLLPSHDLIEEDNFWESDPDAVDVHSNLTKVYDYFLQKHGRRGWDGKNGYTPAVVRYWTAFAQASHHKGGQFLLFGDGGPGSRSYTTPDIVAHEFSHMLTHSIVDLKWHGEAGSIDEAVADIFAVHATFAGSRHPWKIGADVDPARARDLANPKSGGMPDTYEGDHWGEYQSDFGLALGLQDQSRHRNSTVMGYWFYLLSEGEEDGENDHGEEYEIRPIGMDKAADIVYRSLFRLNPMATFASVREATIEVARRRYGRCSEELRQVTNAWNAVGVGDPFCDCFEGSFLYVVDTDEGPQRARHYVRGDHYAVEVTAVDGTTHIMNTTPGDRYRHVQGVPDFPATDPYSLYLKNLFQSRAILVQQPRKPMTRRQYLEYREQHRTGRSSKLGPYETHEYRLKDAIFWTTEDVCLDLTDYGGVLMMRTPEVSEAMRQVFFGFPVRFEHAGRPRVWIEDLREHEVDDRVFQR